MPEFSNMQIPTERITTTQQLQFQPLASQYPKVHRLVALLTTLAIVSLLIAILLQPVIVLPVGMSLALSSLCVIASVIGLSVYVYRHLADPLKGFALREQDISYKSGLFFRTVVTQPILRIQHVELRRGPIDRKFGLANLQVFSAGGSMHTFEIPGLELKHAKQLRQYILSHKDLGLHG
ncbi:PH domain-containing protein [Thalassotalea ponticola]|uniref:PH domain-containing protein n=1 Tax=Thalassotalea ponticola TaxID=1523392 RepID=UPI0025B4B54C|nr:PH domain-containing protein [Thalassotalea ponticola]MDN3652506.1 PH domain-containing protein [Thalassotalea ponticola]